MAEAHSAVAFSFAVTHEGVDVNFDRELLHLVYQSGVRSWKKRIARFKVNFSSCQHIMEWQHFFLILTLSKLADCVLNFASHLFAFFAVDLIDVNLSSQDVSLQDAALANTSVPRFQAKI
jgi:Carnitine O-palmitoyltransferase N-terminus